MTETATAAEKEAVTRTVGMFLHLIDEWCSTTNRYFTNKYGGEIAEDVYRTTDHIRIGVRDLMMLFDDWQTGEEDHD